MYPKKSLVAMFCVLIKIEKELAGANSGSSNSIVSLFEIAQSG
jgi:hypothetical protein